MRLCNFHRVDLSVALANAERDVHSLVAWSDPTRGRRHRMRFCFIVVIAVLLSWNSMPAWSEEAAYSEFSACPQSEGCPVMVRLPGAEAVQLGSPKSEKGRIGNEQQHSVSIKPFAIGKFEVTVREYSACVRDGACQEPEWRQEGSQFNIKTGSNLYYRNLGEHIAGDDFPIVGVSYVDAAAFANWLAKKTGKPYRLPSEREWEYAARGGTTTAYWWGDDVQGANGQAMANCETCGSKHDARGASRVGSYPANPFNLHDMNGNVWEWVADFYCGDYADLPEGNLRQSDDCPKKDAANLRTFRGGSSFYGADKARAASRLRNYPRFRNFSVGFRVAR